MISSKEGVVDGGSCRRAKVSTFSDYNAACGVKFVEWQVGFVGVRVGEASHPGPPQVDDDQRTRALDAMEPLGIPVARNSRTMEELGLPVVLTGQPDLGDDLSSCEGDRECPVVEDAHEEFVLPRSTQNSCPVFLPLTPDGRPPSESDGSEGASDARPAPLCITSSDRHGGESFSSLLPNARARLAVLSVLRLVNRMRGMVQHEHVMRRVGAHQWSAFHVPFLWAAASDDEGHPFLAWLCQIMEHAGGSFDLVGARLRADTITAAFQSARRSLQSLGITCQEGLLT